MQIIFVKCHKQQNILICRVLFLPLFCHPKELHSLLHKTHVRI